MNEERKSKLQRIAFQIDKIQSKMALLIDQEDKALDGLRVMKEANEASYLESRDAVESLKLAYKKLTEAYHLIFIP